MLEKDVSIIDIPFNVKTVKGVRYAIIINQNLYAKIAKVLQFVSIIV